MIDISFDSNGSNFLDNINSYNSLLIVGKGDSEYENTKIVYPSTLKEVEEMFGVNSQLTLAYREAKLAGAPEVYLCNCYKFTDYIDVLDLIAQNEFACIAPLFDFSLTFVNPLDNKETYLSELYSNSLQESFTHIFFTDKHASLYEDIDHYLKTMRSKNYAFKDRAFDRLEKGDNMSFVLNNLKDYKFANVVLAAIISKSSLRYYPKENLGEAVFDITSEDIYDHEFVYFTYDHLAKTIIENMQNYYKEPAPEKMLLVSIIKNRINIALNYEDFSGRLVNAHTKLELENYTNEVLNGFVGKIIESYELLKIKYERAGAGEININIYISIKPYNSIEKITMKVGV